MAVTVLEQVTVLNWHLHLLLKSDQIGRTALISCPIMIISCSLELFTVLTHPSVDAILACLTRLSRLTN